MILKKSIVAVIVMVFALTACSSDNDKKANVLPQESHTVDSTISDEEMSNSENQSDTSDVSTDSSHVETATDNQENNSSTAANVPASKPSQDPIKSPSKPTGGSTSKPNNPGNNGSGSVSKPNTSGDKDGGSTSKPNGENNGESSSDKPTQHVHKWKKQPKGSIFEWENACGPDENGYTTNVEIAENKNGKKIGIYMCAICYEYYGSPSSDEWESRFWDHIEKPGPCCGAGYSSYPVYAVYEVFHCDECDSWKRGKVFLYGYYDYSNNGAKWIYLKSWQIKELNLKM